MTKKFIIHCDPENIVRAALMAEHAVRVMNERGSPQAAMRFSPSVQIESYYRDSNTIIVRQCEGG